MGKMVKRYCFMWVNLKLPGNGHREEEEGAWLSQGVAVPTQLTNTWLF